MVDDSGTLEWSIIKKRPIFKNQYIGLRNDLAKRPDGEVVEYAVVEFRDYASGLCLTEEGNLVLVKQFRYPWLASSWEVPSGLIEEGEDPDDAIIREIQEETGYYVIESQFLLKYHPTGSGNNWAYLYINIVRSGGKQQLDKNEFILVKEFKKREVNAMITKGEIFHGSTILVWLSAKERGLL